MIQDISPHRLFNEYRPRDPREDDLVFAFAAKGQKVLVRVFDETGRLIDRPVTDTYPATPKLVFPRVQDFITNAPDRVATLRFLFCIDETAVFLDTAEEDARIPGFTWLTTRLMRRGQPAEFSFAGATAWHLKEWYKSARFCGYCGSRCVPDTRERAMRCPDCGKITYPRVNPAVIIGVTDGDRIILTRYAERHQSSVYNAGAKVYRGRSLVAGYCEIGETLEDTVRREVMEEVGLHVEDITYYRSQPWGFDGALLMGFFCRAAETEIKIDPSELSEAVWTPRSEIGDLPGSASLTNEMINKFRDAS